MVVPMSKCSGTLFTHKPPIGFFLDRIAENKPFSFCKLNHVFWEAVYEVGELRAEQSGSIAKWWLSLHGVDLMDELLEIVHGLSTDDEDLLFAASHTGPPDESVFHGYITYEDRLRTIESHLPRGYVPFFGQLWKKYALERTLPRLFEAMKRFRVVTVGLQHLKGIGKACGFADFKHMEIGFDATAHRLELLEQFKAEWTNNDFWMFQAGDSLSTWFVHNMHRHTPGWFIDIGRALDMYVPIEQFSIRDDYLKIVPDFYNQIWMHTWLKLI